MENFEKSTEVSYHGIDYILRFSCKDDLLTIIIEQKDNGSRWRNTFNSSYIEEITQKTGNAKKFGVFVKMLLTAISGTTEHVFLDVLTYHDLEMLKARKQNNTSTSTSTATDKSKSNKRYIIMTYVGEFDKVHYPLPLSFEENPDVETLKSTIARLRMELDEVRSTTKSISHTTGEEASEAKSENNLLRSQNEELRKKLKALEDMKKPGAVEYDNLIKTKLDLENEVENLKKEYVRDVGKLKKRTEEAEKELDEARSEIQRLRTELLDPESEEYKKLKGSDDGETSFSKKIITRHQKEIEKLTAELENMRNIDKKSKARIRQLETELEGALKRNTLSRGSNASTGSPYSRSRGASPTAGGSAKRSLSQQGRSYSPGFSNVRKETPTNKAKQSPANRNIFNRTPPSTRKTPSTGSDNPSYQGVLRQRNTNSPSSLRIAGAGVANRKAAPSISSNIRGSPSDSFGARKASPTNNYGMRRNSPLAGTNNQRKDSPIRNYSPSGRGGMTSQLNNKTSPRNQASTTTKPINSGPNNRTVIPSKQSQPKPVNQYQTDSDDDALKNSKPNERIQKLKENIQDFKESKNSTAKEFESSADVGDIDERLNKLQDLLRMAKSQFDIELCFVYSSLY